MWVCGDNLLHCSPFQSVSFSKRFWFLLWYLFGVIVFFTLNNHHKRKIYRKKHMKSTSGKRKLKMYIYRKQIYPSWKFSCRIMSQSECFPKEYLLHFVMKDIVIDGILKEYHYCRNNNVTMFVITMLIWNECFILWKTFETANVWRQSAV